MDVNIHKVTDRPLPQYVIRTCSMKGATFTVRYPVKVSLPMAVDALFAAQRAGLSVSLDHGLSEDDSSTEAVRRRVWGKAS